MVLGLKWIQQGKAELINGRTEVFLLLLIIPWQEPHEYKYVTSIYETYICTNNYSGLEWHCSLLSGLPKSEMSSCNEFYKGDKINYFMIIGLSRWRKQIRYILLKNKLKQKWSNLPQNIEHDRFMCIVIMTVAS